MSRFAIVAMLVFAGAVGAQTTVNVQCKADNTLFEDASGSFSNGSGVSVFVGQNAASEIRRAVLQFDVAAAVPAGASIVSATLRMRVTRCTDLAPLQVTGHRLTNSWGEGLSVSVGGGGGAGGPAQTNDATWLHRFYSTTLWTTPGGDFAPAASFSFAMPLIGTFTVPASPGLVADVQSWLDTPATNHGWVLKSQSETGNTTARRLDSREAAIVNNRPVLSITYLMPGEATTWGSGCPSPTGTYTSSFSGPMIGGTTISMLNVGGPVNGVGANYFALELNHPGVLFAPSCNIYLPLSGNWIFGFVTLYDNAGVGTQPWPLPTAYPGLYFMSQSFALESSAPGGIILTNASVAVLQ